MTSFSSNCLFILFPLLDQIQDSNFPLISFVISKSVYAQRKYRRKPKGGKHLSSHQETTKINNPKYHHESVLVQQPY